MHLKPFEVMIDCFGYCQFGRAFVFRQAKIGDDFSTKFLCLIEVKDRGVFLMILKVIGFTDLLDPLL